MIRVFLVLIILILGASASGYFFYAKKKNSTTTETTKEKNKETTAENMAAQTPANQPSAVEPTASTVGDSNGIFTILKSIATAQTEWSHEKGTYASTFRELSFTDEKVSTLLKGTEKAALTIQNYQIKELFNEEDTDDTRVHYGVMAQAPEASNKPSYLLLMDLNKQAAFSEMPKEIQELPEVQFYQSQKPQKLTKWPNQEVLNQWNLLK